MKRFFLSSAAVIVSHPAYAPGMLIDPNASPARVAPLMAAAERAAANDLAANTSTTDDLMTRDAASAAMIEYWDKTDDIVKGYDAIKGRGETYLPRFPDEETVDYEHRLTQTKFTNIYRDIVESLASKPFESEIKLLDDGDKKTPEQIEEFCEDVDGSGNTLTMFAATTFFGGINSAIDWVLVDYPKVDSERVRTIEDAKRENVRPFWSHVLGRNVLSAKSKIVGGKEIITYVRMLEPGVPNHIRVFERGDDGIVTFRLWQEVKDANGGRVSFILVDAGVISIGVIPMLPFITGRRNGRTFEVFPVMRDAADLQIELYQQESALKYAKVMTAFPMLTGNGVKQGTSADGKTPLKIRVGPHRVLYAPANGDGQFGEWRYISPDAECLKFLADDIKETQQQLRELGRQPLTAQAGNLTVITTAFAAGKARSAVAAWGLNLKNVLENALVLTCMWLDIRDNEWSPQVSVYDEYDDFSDKADDLTFLNTMRSNGDLSQETLWAEAKRRNVLSDEFVPDDERKRLLEEVPSDDNSNPEDVEP